MFFLKLCRNDYIRTMYLLLNKNLLTNLVMLRCMLWGVGLVKVYKVLIRLHSPSLLMSVSEAFSVLFIL